MDPIAVHSCLHRDPMSRRAGGSSLHIFCQGEHVPGTPTVILEAGMGEASLTWATLQPEIAGFARVCSYDRSGYGWSDSSTKPGSGATTVEELHTLLQTAHIDEPYVLVGHSLGGIYVRLYAKRYPSEVKGMVLIDPSHEQMFSRLSMEQREEINRMIAKNVRT
jgi:pimeloyl-ACP methyl ester carboxylesterase